MSTIRTTTPKLSRRTTTLSNGSLPQLEKSKSSPKLIRRTSTLSNVNADPQKSLRVTTSTNQLDKLTEMDMTSMTSSSEFYLTADQSIDSNASELYESAEDDEEYLEELEEEFTPRSHRKTESLNPLITNNQLPMFISSWVLQEREKGIDVFELPEDQSNVRLLPQADHVPQESNLESCTLEKLVQRLTSAKVVDPRLVKTVLQMYRYYTTPAEFLELLILRYTTPCPKCMDSENWNRTQLVPIQIRVVNIFKQWMSDWSHDFKANNELLLRLKSFLQESLENKSLSASSYEHLQKTIMSKIDGTETDRDAVIQLSETPPPSFLPNPTLTKLELTDIRPIELARQMTLLEYELFKKINPSEFLNQAWTKSSRRKTSPNICAVTDQFNNVSAWIATEILKTDHPKGRASVIQYFLVVAQECRSLKNLNGVMEIMAGLHNAAVMRLKDTWKAVSSKSKPLLTSLSQLVSSDENFGRYRKAFKSFSPPCLPYLGLMLRDLTFYEDGNPDLIQNTRLINFRKMRFVSNLFLDIEQAQHTPFCLEKIESIQKFLLNLKPLDEKELFQLSLQREKRICRASLNILKKPSKLLSN